MCGCVCRCVLPEAGGTQGHAAADPRAAAGGAEARQGGAGARDGPAAAQSARRAAAGAQDLGQLGVRLHRRASRQAALPRDLLQRHWSASCACIVIVV